MKWNRKWDMHALSDARSHLLGLATLWIAMFHSLHLDFFQPILFKLHLVDRLNRLRDTGNCGVDIFLFLSGFGLYFSLTRLRRESAHPLKGFYRHRFSRVLPSYLVVSILYYGFIGTKGHADWMGKIFLYGFFSPILDGGRYWYFALLFALYLLFPLIWKAIDRGGFPAMCGLVALSIAGTMILKAVCTERYFGATELIWTRIPIFLVGVYIGKLSQRHVRIPVIIPILAVPLAVIVWHFIPQIPKEESYLRRYAYAPLTVLISLAHSWLYSLRPWKSLFHRGIILIGMYSLEIYLIYENLYLMDIPLFQNVDPIGVIYALTTFVAALLLSGLLRIVLNLFRRDLSETSLPRDVPFNVPVKEYEERKDPVS